MRRFVLIVVCWLVVAGLLAPVISASPGISVNYLFETKSVRQGESGWVDVTIKNTGGNQVRITWVGIHFDWYDADVYLCEDYESAPLYLAASQSTTIRLSFSVGVEISIGQHSYDFVVHFDEDEWIIGWMGHTHEGITHYDFNVLERDRDGDGVADSDDAFPDNASEWSDSDNDGVGNNQDVFPFDPTEWADSDGDGYGDNTDAFPNDATEWIDTDGDGYGDNHDDAFPDDASEWKDSDGDGVGDNTDAFPHDSGETVDSDGDGVGDNSDYYPSDPTKTTYVPPDSSGNDVDDPSTVEPWMSGSNLILIGLIIAIAIITIVGTTVAFARRPKQPPAPPKQPQYPPPPPNP